MKKRTGRTEERSGSISTPDGARSAGEGELPDRTCPPRPITRGAKFIKRSMEVAARLHTRHSAPDFLTDPPPARRPGHKIQPQQQNTTSAAA
uniref:Uncharacterized protein n=1 Tax=Plectus sambesii TaxID=2011161 RepID=A0A914WTM1_9BILA